MRYSSIELGGATHVKSKPSLLLFLMIGFLVFGIAGADDRSKLVEKMTKTLTKSKKAEEREDAAKTLGTLKAVEAVGVLAGALKDPTRMCVGRLRMLCTKSTASNRCDSCVEGSAPGFLRNGPVECRCRVAKKWTFPKIS